MAKTSATAPKLKSKREPRPDPTNATKRSPRKPPGNKLNTKQSRPASGTARTATSSTNGSVARRAPNGAATPAAKARAAAKTDANTKAKAQAAKNTSSTAAPKRPSRTSRPTQSRDCRDLLVSVSKAIPEVSAAVAKATGCSFKTITAPKARPDAHNLLDAFLLDVAFMRKHRAALLRAHCLPGAILVWDPDGQLKAAEQTAFGERIYQVLHAIPKPENFATLLRNLRRRLHLERELTRKDATLAEVQKLNDELLSVGIALSAERDNTKLLHLILQKIRDITHADAGTIFLLTKDPESGESKLKFAYMQNDSVPGGELPAFLLPITKASIVGFVAITGKQLNIANAYEIPESADYSFNQAVDRDTGYWTRSMLTVPIFNHLDELIGVVQLLNKKIDPKLKLRSADDADAWVIPFPKENDAIVLALASQAGVSLENNLLYQEIENLFAGFVAASVQAIESRDPITSGHSSRVTEYTVALAEAVNGVRSGPYAKLQFDAERLQELRYSGLLHDFGKVGVSEVVLQKAKKLYPDQFEEVMTRFAYVLSQAQLDNANARLAFLHKHGKDKYAEKREQFDLELQQEMARLRSYQEVVRVANEPKVLDEEPSALLVEIAKAKYRDIEGRSRPLLSKDELTKLSIPRGSLDDEERGEIESHAVHSYSFLEQIPWSSAMARVPEIARGHHETLNGQGYPRGVKGKDIPPETRMMTIADIYDALTASDRPYKRAKTKEEALAILKMEAKDNKVDADLLKVFINKGVYKIIDELLP